MSESSELEARLERALARISDGLGQLKQTDDLEAAMARQAEEMTRLDSDLQRLRATNDALRAVNTQLREANAAGLADASLVDAAMAAELDALKAARAADKAEVDAVLSALEPVIEEDA